MKKDGSFKNNESSLTPVDSVEKLELKNKVKFHILMNKEIGELPWKNKYYTRKEGANTWNKWIKTE